MSKEIKLLLHVPSSDRWEVALVNAINFLKTKGENEELKVKIISNYEGVTVVKACEPGLFDKMRQLCMEGGEIYLCENALNRFEIKKESLADFFKTVPVSIRAIADHVSDGWIYVRP